MALISLSLSSHALDVIVCGNKPAVSTAIRPSGLSEGDGSIATGSRIATVMDHTHILYAQLGTLVICSYQTSSEVTQTISLMTYFSSF